MRRHGLSRRAGPERALLVLVLGLLPGCGAQELYKPPTAPYAVVGRLPLPSKAEDVSVLGGVAYVAAGQAGLAVVDISTPSAPRLIKLVDTVKYAESVRVASTLGTGGVTDIAFVVEGTEGITTYDVTEPDSAFSFQQGTTAVDGNGLAIELPADPTEPYVVYLAENWKGLRIFESDPAMPGLLRYNGVFAPTRGFAKAVDVEGGFAYVADDEMGLAVLDVRARALGAVRLVSSCDTGGNAMGVASAGRFVFIADGAEGLVVMETRDEGSPPVPVPYLAGRLALDGKSKAIVVRDSLAFIAAQDGGLHVVDVTHPAAPRWLGTVLTSFATGVALAESGVVVVSDRDEGLVVLGGQGPFRDRTPPAAVSDLAATALSASAVRLRWGAPGDDGFTGTAAGYDVRWALAPIATPEAWEAANRAAGEPAPGPRGSAESFVVDGLAADTEVHFALRTGDSDGNWSGLSNAASARTAPGNVAPNLIDLALAPVAGTRDSTFVFEVTYIDGDGDPPAVARVVVGGIEHDMVRVAGDYTTGARFRFAGQLEPGAYTYGFIFGDAGHDPVHTRLREGPWVGRIAFVMGSPEGEPGRDADETQHTVVLVEEVEFSLHEVTQAQYDSVMGTGANPSRFRGPDLPVENVTWLDAIAYLNARSAREGLTPAYAVAGDQVTWNRDAGGWRLPTEAEWEAYCRAGTTTAFAAGEITEEACGVDPVLDASGWYCGNAGASTHAVMGKAANAWGLRDMPGNVWEWCWDWYAADLGPAVAADPAGPTSGSQRVIRGGSWYYFARDCRSASRAPYWPNSKDDVVGFRAVRTRR